MDYEILHASHLESRDDLLKEHRVHSQGIRIRQIQVGLVENVPVFPVFCKDKSSRLVGRNPSHCRRCFVSACNLEVRIGHAESIRFIVGENPALPRGLGDYPHAKIGLVPGHLLLDVGNFGRITCGHTSNPQTPP